MNCPRVYGFTLIELMITLSIAALVLTLGVPSFRNTILDNRQVSELNTLVAELNWARSEAVARNVTVTLGRTGSTWNAGWQVFVDVNRNGSVDTGQDSVLRERTSPGSDFTITFPWARVTYNPMGASNVAGTFVFCDSRGWTKARGAVLSFNGRLTATRDDDRDGYVEGPDGHLTCP